MRFITGTNWGGERKKRASKDEERQRTGAKSQRAEGMSHSWTVDHSSLNQGAFQTLISPQKKSMPMPGVNYTHIASRSPSQCAGETTGCETHKNNMKGSMGPMGKARDVRD